MYSCGQDSKRDEEQDRAIRGYLSARFWDYVWSSNRDAQLGFRPILEVLNSDTLGFDGLKAVALDLDGGKLGDSSEDIQIIVKTGSDFTAPASDGLTRPDGDTGNFFMWLGSNGSLYAPADSVPADVTALTVQWTVPTYAVTLHPNGGTINSGNVTGYTYGVGATLPTADDMTYTGHTFKGWYDNENLTGSPVTAIGGTETGNKEYWAKWEINQYTITVKPENGSFILSAADGEQKIVATDKAGNTAEMTVTVNDGHTGGTATCTERAVCEVCGKAYGDLDGNHHANLKHIDAKAATKIAGGNIEYWYCEDCDKYFADAEATKEIKQADTVTAKLSGAAKSPQTGGDSGVLTVLLLSGGAFICLVSRRKKRTHTV